MKVPNLIMNTPLLRGARMEIESWERTLNFEINTDGGPMNKDLQNVHRI